MRIKIRVVMLVLVLLGAGALTGCGLGGDGDKIPDNGMVVTMTPTYTYDQAVEATVAAWPSATPLPTNTPIPATATQPAIAAAPAQAGATRVLPTPYPGVVWEFEDDKYWSPAHGETGENPVRFGLSATEYAEWRNYDIDQTVSYLFLQRVDGQATDRVGYGSTWGLKESPSLQATISDATRIHAEKMDRVLYHGEDHSGLLIMVGTSGELTLLENTKGLDDDFIFGVLTNSHGFAPGVVNAMLGR